MSKTQKDAKKPIQAKCLDDDDDIDPEGTMNDQGKELKTNEDTTQDYTYEEISEEAPKYLTVFGLTAGSFDFCSRNPLCEAYHHSSVAGQLLALTQVTMNLFNNNCLCLLGYSFGSLVAFSACLTLFQLGCRDRIGDVCLMASPIDVKVLESSIHKLIGIKGVVQGKLTIVYARCDETLNYFVKSSRLAEEPVGLQRIDHKGLKSSLRENDPVLATYSEDQLDDYLSNKFDNFDASGIVEGHFNYPSKFSRIVQQLDFNNDLSRFINSKHN